MRRITTKGFKAKLNEFFLKIYHPKLESNGNFKLPTIEYISDDVFIIDVQFNSIRYRKKFEGVNLAVIRYSASVRFDDMIELLVDYAGKFLLKGFDDRMMNEVKLNLDTHNSYQAKCGGVYLEQEDIV